MLKKSLFCHLFSAIIFLMLLTGFSGCNNLTGGNNKPSDDNDGKVYLQVNVASASRTALPQFDIDSISDFTFILTGKGPGSGTFTALTDDPTNNPDGEFSGLDALQGTSFPIQAGEWTFKLTASKEGTVLSSEEVSETIGSGEKTLSFDLKWEDTNLDETKTGSLSFTLDFSAAPNKNDVQTVTATLVNTASDSTTLSEQVILDRNDTPAVYVATYNSSTETALANLSAGKYRIILKLFGVDISTNTNVLINTWTELAIITGGQESTGSSTMNSLNEVYTINWNLDGGSSSVTLPECYTRLSSDYHLPEVSKDGYNFDGWYTGANGTGTKVETIAHGSTGTQNLYAKWTSTSSSYTVKHWKQTLSGGDDYNETNYTCNDANQIESKTGTIATQTAATAMDTTSGAFIGFIAPSASEIESAQVTINADGSSVVNLYYKRQTYMVSYDDNVTGEVLTVPTSVACRYGGSVDVNFTTIDSRTGYTFNGWKDNSSGITYTASGTTSLEMGTSAITLYAQWTLVDYPINYNLDGGSLPVTSPHTFQITSNDITLDTPTKTGYYFVGWYEDSGFTISVTTIPQGSHEEKNIYAFFTNEIYVSSTGTDTNDGLRDSSAVDSIATAVSKIVSIADSSIDWTIKVLGKVTGIQIIDETLTSSEANSILIDGVVVGGVDPCLDGDSLSETENLTQGTNKTTLSIKTAVPVTITNLVITGGRGTWGRGGTSEGGGLYLYQNAKVSLGDGVKIYGNNSTGTGGGNGGGVYVSINAVLCMYGSAIIGATDKIFTMTADSTFETIQTSVASPTYGNWECANCASNNGGGVCVYGGIIALGYSSYTDGTTNTPAMFTGGIYGNCSGSGGGGLSIEKGGGTSASAIVSGGSLMNNIAFSSGGAIRAAGTNMTLIDGLIKNNYAANTAGGIEIVMYQSSANSTDFYMNGGQINFNTCYGGDGAAVYLNTGNNKFIMTGGTISSNITYYASGLCGGVAAVDSNSYTNELTITGGSITANEIGSGLSHAIKVLSGTLTLGGSASIPYADGSLSNTLLLSVPITTSTPDNSFGIHWNEEPTNDTTILTGGGPSDYEKFSLFQDSSWINTWTINYSTGKACMP